MSIKEAKNQVIRMEDHWKTLSSCQTPLNLGSEATSLHCLPIGLISPRSHWAMNHHRYRSWHKRGKCGTLRWSEWHTLTTVPLQMILPFMVHPRHFKWKMNFRTLNSPSQAYFHGGGNSSFDMSRFLPSVQTRTLDFLISETSPSLISYVTPLFLSLYMQVFLDSTGCEMIALLR